MSLHQMTLAIKGKTSKKGGLDFEEIKNVLSNHGIAVDGKRVDLEQKLTKLLQQLNAEQNGVYNPFYKRKVEIYGDENCDRPRESINIDLPYSIRQYASKYCDVLPLKAIDYILGPVSHSEHGLDDTHIAVFGEIHRIQKDCVSYENSVTFSSFMKSLITQNPDVFYDIYLEMEYINEDKPDRKKYTDESVTFRLLEYDFRQCLSLEKECPYKNIRVHYVDYRRIADKLGFGIYSDMIHRKPIPLSAHFSDFFTLEQYDSYSWKTLDFVLNDPGMKKELAKCTVADKLLEHTRQRCENLYNDYKVLLETIPEDLMKRTLRSDFSGGGDSRWIRTLAAHFMIIGAVIMDVYALARMFRRFNTEIHTEPKNIIIYTGDYHSRYYREFFSFLGFQLNFYHEIEDSSCLDIRSVKGKSFLWRSS